MKTNTYSNGETFAYDDNDELVFSFYKGTDGRFRLNVYDSKSIAETNVYSRQNGELRYSSITND